MNQNQNSVCLTGFAGSDPVIVYFAEDKKMARVNLGVHEFFRNSLGDMVEQTLWFSLIFWNGKVDLVDQIVRKGAHISIEGRLSAQHYIDKHGIKQYSTEIVVHRMELKPHS